MALNIQAQGTIPTDYGQFRMLAFGESAAEQVPHLVLVADTFNAFEPVLVRIHSECITGDVFGSHRCDCGEQLHRSLQWIGEQGGVLIYLRQEGRGIGIINKLKAYNLQDQGINTAEANVHLGFEVDQRTYDQAVEILELLGIHQIKLLTNNPDKLDALKHSSITVAERVPLEIAPNQTNRYYLETKKKIMGHLLDLGV